jgi:nucleoside-diphosphate-sugar epimerase
VRIAVTGGTGFIGRYLIRLFSEHGHAVRAWYRPTSDRTGLEDVEQLEWTEGQLGNEADANRLVRGVHAVVHSALHHPGGGFRGGEGELTDFVQTNIVGTIQLIEAARAAGVNRFVFVSTCAVHEKILPDRDLDEDHPLYPYSHYGAHKAAIEKFVHSYGLGQGYPICALRPTGVYGLNHPVDQSRWFELIRQVARGERIEVAGGGKEVHVADVARACEVLVTADADRVAGEAFNCYDTYISQLDVAQTAKQLSGSEANIVGDQKRPMNQIKTDKLRDLGMEFGGWTLFEQTVGELVDAVRGGA